MTRQIQPIQVPAGSGAGTVTSVALTAPARQTVTGSPVTTSGILAITDNVQNANLVFAGPATGAAAAPTFRALVTADMPAGTGTVTSVSGTSNQITSTGGATPVLALAAAVTMPGTLSMPVGSAFTPAQLAGIIGTTTNNDAAAGSVGEYISAELLAGSAVSLTNNTAATVLTIALTAGDWDCFGMCINLPNGATTQTSFIAGISLSSSANPATAVGFQGALFYNALSGTGLTLAGSLSGFRASLNAPATLYLRAISNFAVNTMAAYGYLAARRRR